MKTKKLTNPGILVGTKVLVGDKKLKSFLKEKGFGEEEKKTLSSRIELSLIEALFLIENKKLEVIRNDKKLTFEDLVKIGESLEKNFYEKFLVFRDLRKRGLLVRTGFKFGADFRVYERGAKIKSSHSKFLVHVIPEEYSCSFPELSRAVRLANSVNKKMVFAVVDEESNITYYLVERIGM